MHLEVSYDKCRTSCFRFNDLSYFFYQHHTILTRCMPGGVLQMQQVEWDKILVLNKYISCNIDVEKYSQMNDCDYTVRNS